MPLHIRGIELAGEIEIYFVRVISPPELDSSGRVVEPAFQGMSFFQTVGPRNGFVTRQKEYGDPGTIIEIGTWSRNGESITNREVLS